MKGRKRKAIEIGNSPGISSAHNLALMTEGDAWDLIERVALVQRIQKLGKRLLCLATHHQINGRIGLQGSHVHSSGLGSAKGDNRVRLLAFHLAGNAQCDGIAAANTAKADEIKFAFVKIRRREMGKIAFVLY